MAQPPIVRMNPSTLPDAGQLGYSQISIVPPGRIAYVSGQVAARADGAPVPESHGAQMEIVARNAAAALDALGAEPHDIAIARCYVVDLTPQTLDEIYPALLAFLDGAQPSITGVGVAALAGPDLKVELELTVRLPD